MSEVFKTKEGGIAHQPPRHKDRLGLPREELGSRKWEVGSSKDGQRAAASAGSSSEYGVLSRAYLMPHPPTANP